MFDSLMGKAENALENFMDDQQKVDKAKEKAKEFLSKRLGEEQAGQVVDQTEGVLDTLAHRHKE